jgi:hypothetical protein
MPPFLISPLMKFALGAFGAAAVVHWTVREVRRINDDLARVKAAKVVDPMHKEVLPTLRRDPASGEWRVS